MLCTRWDDYKKHFVRFGIPSIAAVCTLCASILHAYQYALQVSYAPVTYMFDLFAIVAIVNCVYAYYYSYKHAKAIVTIKITIAILWIIAVTSVAIYNTVTISAQTINPHKGIFQAQVIEAETKRYNTIATVQCTAKNGNYKAVCIFDTHYTLYPGDTLILNTTAHPTRSESNPYLLYYARQGVAAVMYCNNDSVVSHSHAPIHVRILLQERIKQFLYYHFNPDTASLLSALYLGNKDYIHPHVQLMFKNAGVLHVLAASGLHVGIILFGIFSLCKAFSLPKKIAVVIAAIPVCFYFYISCQPVSLLRASVMCVVAAFCIAFNFHKHNINILSLTAVITLCLYPYELFNPGFQLSFMATAGILLLYTRYQKSLHHTKKLAGPLAITFAAQLFTMPVSVYHFQELSTTAFISNLVIIPLVSFFMIAGLCTPVIHFVGLQSFFTYAMHTLYSLIAFLVSLFATLPGMIGIYSLTLVFVYALLCIIPLLYTKRGNVLICSVVLLLILYWNAPKTRNTTNFVTDSAGYAVAMNTTNAQCIMSIDNNTCFHNLVAELTHHGIKNVSLMLPDATFKNCTYAIRLGRKFAIQKIIIGNYTIHSIKKLTYAAYIDSIPLIFANSKPEQLKEWEKLYAVYVSMRKNSK